MVVPSRGFPLITNIPLSSSPALATPSPDYFCSPSFAAQPMTNSFVSVPADLGQLNCAALVAGVIAGVLDGASFVSFSLRAVGPGRRRQS